MKIILLYGRADGGMWVPVTFSDNMQSITQHIDGGYVEYKICFGYVMRSLDSGT